MNKKILPYILLTPMILIMGVLVFHPIIATFTYSMKKWKLTAPADIKNIGFRNYVEVLQSDSFRYSMQNTIYILILVVVCTTFLGCSVAMFLNMSRRCSGILLALSILPWALPPFVNGILWKFVFFSGYGFLNKLLIGIGMTQQPIEFLASRWSLLTVIAIVVIWRSTPFMTLVCLAGRQSIPEGLYEAARIDGGNRFHIFYHITLPLMLPFVVIGLTTTSVTAINVFDEIVALSGYSDLGKNILMESYLTTFEFLNFGKGAAITYIVMALAFVIGIFYLRSLDREVEY